MRRPPFFALPAALLVLMAGCSAWAEHDQWPSDHGDSFVITTGNPAGIYAVYGDELGASIQERAGIEVEVLHSGGSVENLHNLTQGRADLAFAAGDAAADAVAGRGAFGEPQPIRALARIYDDFVHLVVPAESDIDQIDDLRGRSVAIGAPGSGTALIADRLLHAAGHKLEHLDIHELSLADSLDALARGEVDALFWSGGLSTPALEAFAATEPIRLLPLGHLADDLRTQYGSGYRPGTIVAGVYGLPSDVLTLAVPNILVVRAAAPDDLVRAQLATLFAVQDQIAERVPAAAVLDRAKAIFTDPVQLHPGAVTFYRDGE